MIGTVLSHYRIVEKIGEGGMGEVYRAEDMRLPRSVAVKILPERALASLERRERFIREARAASSLNHPGIVHIYDVDESDGRLFIAMEYVKGRTVAAMLRERRLRMGEILGIAIEAGEALAAAHAHGIVHRDVKPSNIIVAAEGFVKILDFGLAKLLAPGDSTASPEDASTRAPNLTRHGQLIGTVLYMSPELALGEEVDQRSDIFSFGAVLYEMASGKLPFSGGSEVAVLDQVLHGEPPPLADSSTEMPGGFERIVAKAMEKRPEDRYQSMGDLLVDLRHVRRELEEGTEPRPMRPHEARGAASRRPPAARRAALWGGLVIVAALGVALWMDRWTGEGVSAAERAGRAVAVLPFENAGGDPDSKYFSDGVTEAIIVDLSRIEGLRVLAPPAGAVAEVADPLAAGRRLQAESILEGSVRREGGQVRVTARLMDVRDGRVIWSERFDGPLMRIFELQDEVSRRIAQAMQIRLTAGEEALIAKPPTSNLKAYDLYLRGRELTTRRVPTDLRRAVEMFARARDLDPDFALAYTGLADAFAVALMYGWDLGADAHKGAEEASRRAIALDPTLAEAHLSRGVVAALDGDLEGGTSRVLHAVSLAPDSARAHHWLAVLYKLNGNYERARAEDLAALRLDPELGVAHLNLAHIAILAHRPEEAAARMQALLEVRSDLPLARVLLAWALLRQGDPRGSLEMLAAAAAVAPDDPLVAGMRGMALAATGDAAGARSAAREAVRLAAAAPTPLADYAVACIYAQTGDHEEAIRALEKALHARTLGLSSIISAAYIRDDPVLAGLRSDPRFASLVGSL